MAVHQILYYPEALAEEPVPVVGTIIVPRVIRDILGEGLRTVETLEGDHHIVALIDKVAQHTREPGHCRSIFEPQKSYEVLVKSLEDLEYPLVQFQIRVDGDDRLVRLIVQVQEFRGTDVGVGEKVGFGMFFNELLELLVLLFCAVEVVAGCDSDGFGDAYSHRALLLKDVKVLRDY